jgi:hypothetical protein
MTLSKVRITLLIVILVLLGQIQSGDAGIFSNFRGFLLRRLGLRKKLNDEIVLQSFSATDSEVPKTAGEIIVDLTANNELLRAQVLSLKTFINMQKKQLARVKREKDILQRSAASQEIRLLEERKIEQENIKNELRSVFEEEKIVMINSFEEEKELIKEDYIVEIKDIKLQLMEQLNKKSEDYNVLLETNTVQAEQIVSLKKSDTISVKVRLSFFTCTSQLHLVNSLVTKALTQRNSIQDIAELKEALRAKEIAITELNRKSVQDAANAVKVNSISSESKPKKLREGTLPMSTSTGTGTSGSSSKTVGGTSKTAGSRGRSRPPLAGSQSASQGQGQSATPSPRSGL